MTTKAATVHSFLAGFGIPAYAATSVPDDAEFPYLTYYLVDGAWGDAAIPAASLPDVRRRGRLAEERLPVRPDRGRRVG